MSYPEEDQIMELSDAIRGRRSIRRFLPDPVSRDTIGKIVELARWAPSWGNTQPWDIVYADGEKVKALTEAFVEEASNGNFPRPDIVMPVDFPEKYKNRYVSLGRALFTKMGIERQDMTARTEHYMNMYRFFGAPGIFYLTILGELNEPYSCLDLGSVGTTICYGAFQEGLGTIYLAASMHYPDVVRRILDIPGTQKVVIGIAIGKPHPDHPASLFRSERESVETILRFA
jgi:nitroreductase